MVGLVVIGHAPFATALFSCARHVYGCDPERCIAIDIAADAEPDVELARARAAVHDVDRDDGVLVLVDMFGATPGNIAAGLSRPGSVEVVAGVNLPMLMRVLCYRDRTPFSELPEKAVGGGASGIMKIASTASCAPCLSSSRVPDADAPNQDTLTEGTPDDGVARLHDQQ